MEPEKDLNSREREREANRREKEAPNRLLSKAESAPYDLRRWQTAARQTSSYARAKIANAVEMILGPTTESDAAAAAKANKPTVWVGPVIGKVTTDSARILLEVSHSAAVSVALTEAGDAPITPRMSTGSALLRRAGSSIMVAMVPKKLPSEDTKPPPQDTPEIEKAMALEGGCPTVFEFLDLKPHTRYLVRVKGCQGSIPSSSFRTLSESPETMNVGVISCNKIFITKETITLSRSDLWADLAKVIESTPLDLLVHLGDQIYGDGDKTQDARVGPDRDKWSNRFRRANEMMKDVPREEWEQRRVYICESYREVYRETWQHSHTATCLANCSNLMIYDDHEVRDNWGDVEEDWNSDSLDFFIAHCAWTVTLEYQRQLYEDVNFTKLEMIKKDYHFHVLGGVGFMFLDVRGSRTFHREKEDPKPYLGSRQWVDIKNSLTKEGLFGQVNALVICSPAPLVFLDPFITGKVSLQVEDFKGHWSVKPHQNEQFEMIQSLEAWKDSSKKREILFLGGDVHCGGHSVIMKAGKVLFRQLTTSAIANTPLPKLAYYGMRALEQLTKLSPEYSFSHNNWTRARNYAIVQIKNHTNQEEMGRTEIAAQLVRGKPIGVFRGPRISSAISEQSRRRATTRLFSCGSTSQVAIGSMKTFRKATSMLERPRKPIERPQKSLDY